MKHAKSDNINEAIDEIPPPAGRIVIKLKKGKLNLVKCRNCKNAKCIDACEQKAIKRNDEGYVLIDRTLCEGCGDCIEACPFDAIHLDESGLAVKCDFCLDLEVPVCVSNCPTGAIEFTDEKEEGKKKEKAKA
jgi:Fe-S-cluster-containing hydrogenase component 2